ncbi:hypothetical protein JJB07_19285 [Tumebacillus sp. ITR2]|uniref:DUF2935 domain-containing protein n=1 Tax=Tumebacillus amylolyticus TaxID=2801339 RepID=A0ABS1JEM5_9BACL|nr:hypothetical protein [Tumebacillus amylolyticus]MBL0388748.1 hypothetical protein [Tumebacillus amylolyticus]
MQFTMQELIAEAKGMAKSREWGTGYQAFWASVQAGTVEAGLQQLFLEEWLYFHSRQLEFGSAILHVNIHEQVMFALSAHFVMVSSLNLKAVESRRHEMPYPATEALSNLLLIMSETDPAAFLTASTLLAPYVFRADVLKSGLAQFDLSQEERDVLVKYTNILAATEDSVEKCLPYFAPVSANDRIRILNQVQLLLETADLIFQELGAAEPKWVATA